VKGKGREEKNEGSGEEGVEGKGLRHGCWGIDAPVPFNPVRGLGSTVSSPGGARGRSLSGNRFWCILALKSDIWWQQF